MIPSTDSPTPAAWAFVLANAQTIKQAAAKWSDRRVEREDFHHELVVDIARNHHKFDPNRSQAKTWIFLKARSLKDHMLRALSSRHDRAHDVLPVMVETEDGAVVDPPALGWGAMEPILISIELKQVVALGTPAMRDACRSHLEEWSGDEVREAWGCTMTARNDRLRRLGARVQRRGDTP
jgi:hypothetical protein